MPSRFTRTRTRTPVRIGTARRRVDTARMFNSAALIAATPATFKPMGAWQADLGMAGNLPGLTIAGIRYRLSIASTVAQTNNVAWGFIVAERMITTAADFGPKAHEHLDWMEYGRGVFSTPALTDVQLLGGGDDGFRTVRSKRKLREIEDELVFVIESAQAITFNLSTSVAVMLP